LEFLTFDPFKESIKLNSLPAGTVIKVEDKRIFTGLHCWRQTQKANTQHIRQIHSRYSIIQSKIIFNSHKRLNS